MRSGVDVEIYEDAISRPSLRELRAGLAEADSHEAMVLANGEERIVRSVRRTRRVTVADDLTELARRCFDDLRPRLEARFSVALGACETPQFLRYERGDRFAAHQDNSSRPGEEGSPSRRRVSVVLFLGAGGERQGAGLRGGDLTFFDTSASATWQTCRVPIRPPEGSAVAFPSDLVHEVTAVRSGTRLSAVTWFPAND